MRDAATNLSFTIASYSEWERQRKAQVSSSAGIARMRPIHQRIAIADMDARDPASCKNNQRCLPAAARLDMTRGFSGYASPRLRVTKDTVLN